MATEFEKVQVLRWASHSLQDRLLRKDMRLEKIFKLHTGKRARIECQQKNASRELAVCLVIRVHKYVL